MTTRHYDIATMLGIAVIMFLCAVAPAHGDEAQDSVVANESPRTGKGPIDYIAWPISTALKLPWFVLATVVSQPVKFAENQNLLPTLQNWVEHATKYGIYPVVNYQSTAGLAGGLGINQRNFFGRGIGLKVKGTYSTNTYRYAYLRVGGKHWGDGPLGLSGEIGWRVNTQERFYGIGSDSDINNEVNYGFRGVFGDITGFWQIPGGFEIKAFVAYRCFKPEDGRWAGAPWQRDSIKTIFAGQNLFGLFETLGLAEYGVGAEYDRRIRPGSPLGGGRGKLGVSYIAGRGEDDTDVGLWKIHTEAEYYINLFSGRVIGLQVLAESNNPDVSTQIPFYYLARMGGTKSLRGYTGGRFADRDMVVFTAEYRWPLWRRLDAVIFADQGRVFSNIFDEFRFSNFRSSYGFGLRIWRTAGHSSISFAQSAEAFKFYFKLES